MYAVIKTGGKQYRVTKGDQIKVEKLNAAVGDNVIFDEVLLVADGSNINIGSPHVKDAAVKASVLTQSKAKKVKIIKFRRRKHSLKRQGHRQLLTTLSIEDISVSSKTESSTSKKNEPKSTAKKPAVEKKSQPVSKQTKSTKESKEQPKAAKTAAPKAKQSATQTAAAKKPPKQAAARKTTQRSTNKDTVKSSRNNKKE